MPKSMTCNFESKLMVIVLFSIEYVINVTELKCTVKLSECSVLSDIILLLFGTFLVELNVQDHFRSEEQAELFNGSGDIFYCRHLTRLGPRPPH